MSTRNSRRISRRGLITGASALAAHSALAGTITPQIGGGINQFDGALGGASKIPPPLPGGAGLLYREANGLGIDFTYATAAKRLALMNSGVLAEFDPKTFLVNITTSPKYLYKVDGSRGYTDHNFVQFSTDSSQGTGAVSGVTVNTQTVADPDGAQIADTLTFAAGDCYYYKNLCPALFPLLAGETYVGSVWLRASAPVSIPLGMGNTTSLRSVINITTAWQQFFLPVTSVSAETGYAFGLDNRTFAGGDRLAKTIFACRWQVNIGFTPCGYKPTAGSVAAVALPQDYDPITHAPIGLRIERSRTNSVLNAGAPATQSRSLGAGTYTAWIEGSGSCVLSGGPTGTATVGSPVTFTLGSTTTVTFTISGSPSWLQCEDSAVPTSRIATYSTAGIRAEDSDSIPTSAFPYSSFAGTIYVLYQPFARGPNNSIWQLYKDSNNHIDNNAVNTVSLSNTQGGANDANFAFGTAQAILSQTTCAYAVNSYAGSLDGDAVTTDTSVALPSAATTLYIGNGGLGGTALDGLVQKFVYVPRRVADNSLPTWRYSPPVGPFDVIAVLGQSNTYFAFGTDPTIDFSGPNVFQYGRPNAGEPYYTAVSAPIVNGNEPLMHKARAPGYIGFAVALARDYYVPNKLAAGRQVLLVPCGLGSTGFNTGDWNPGNALYEDAIARINAAVASAPGNKLVGVLWMQGENEAGFGGGIYTQSQYQTALDLMIGNLRSRTTGGSNVPVVVGSLRPGYVTFIGATAVAVEAALSGTPGRVSNTGFADANSAPAIGTGTQDVHYFTAEQRSFAQRWWTALSPLL